MYHWVWSFTIDHAGNRSLVIHVRKENELLVDKLGESDGVRCLSIQVGLREEKGEREEGKRKCCKKCTQKDNMTDFIHPSWSPLSSILQPRGQPLFPLINQLLAEGLEKEEGGAKEVKKIPSQCKPTAHQLNGTVIITTGVLEVNAMTVHVREILLRFFACTCSKTFVVLHTPGLVVLCLGLPALELGQAEERNLFSALWHLQNIVQAAQVIRHGNHFCMLQCNADKNNDFKKIHRVLKQSLTQREKWVLL